MGQQRLSGLIAAPFTAMDADGNVNLDTIEKQAKLLVGNGVKGAFICGTTGEGVSLTIQERIAIAEKWSPLETVGTYLAWRVLEEDFVFP